MRCRHTKIEILIISLKYCIPLHTVNVLTPVNTFTSRYFRFPCFGRMSTPHRVADARRGLERAAVCGYSRCGCVDLVRNGCDSISMTDYEGRPAWFCSFTCLWMAKYERGGDSHSKVHRPDPALVSVYEQALKTYRPLRKV